MMQQQQQQQQQQQIKIHNKTEELRIRTKGMQLHAKYVYTIAFPFLTCRSWSVLVKEFLYLPIVKARLLLWVGKSRWKKLLKISLRPRWNQRQQTPTHIFERWKGW